MRCHLSLILPVMLVSLSAPLQAQEKLHASYKVAEQYLSAIHLHEWEKAVKMVEKKSLENLKVFQKRYLHSAPTMAEEEELLRLLGMSEISDIDDMSPEAVFIARGKAKTKKLVDADKHIAQMRKTLKLRTLGTVPDGAAMVHAIIRKQFSAEEKAFEELAWVSLVKEGKVWKISLDAQEPKIYNLNKPKKK